MSAGGSWPKSTLPDIKVADLRAASASEFEAKKRVAELKRQLERERTRYSMDSARHNKLHEAAVYRRTLDQLTGKDVAHKTKAMCHAKASEEGLLEMSRFLNKMMSRVFADPSKRSWFNLFCAMDEDRTGRIMYSELHAYVRKRLELSVDELSDAKLLAVWAALDADGSGSLTSGEFGRFMRLATRHPEQSWKERHAASQAGRGRLARQQTAVLSGKAVANALASLPPADPALVQRISELINTKLTIFPDPQTRTWYMLFKHIDDDATGRISHDEFAGFVRDELELGAANLPEQQLDRVWKALDDDDSGFITVAEFGPFMRIGARAYKLRKHERTPQEIFAEKQMKKKRHWNTELAAAAKHSELRILDNTAALQREAEQLQRALKLTTSARSHLAPRPGTKSAPRLPSVGPTPRPSTSMGLGGHGKAGGEYNDDKRVMKQAQSLQGL